MTFTWVNFYKEFADKLMNYRNDRKPLLDLIYQNREKLLAGYLHDKDGENDLLTDVDPFTIFGLFNRGIKHENRINSTIFFKEKFNIKSDVPNDFNGIPILNNQTSYFFGYRGNREKNDIENLWHLYEKIVKDEVFEEEFNTVIKQYGINRNITMALFWIRPEKFLAFDSTNRKYLDQNYKIKIPTKIPKYKEYIDIVNKIKDEINAKTIKEKDFMELSFNANHSGNKNNEYDDDIWNDRYEFYLNLWKKRQNIILQGAPGTGKTFRVPELVVRLCNPDFDSENATREELMKIYNQLKDEKRVMFTTFHQSMDYEDWMEGLRPIVTEKNQVQYNIEPGVFKKLCEEADKHVSTTKEIEISKDANIWKVTLFGTGDNPVRRDCMKNGYIRIGIDENEWSVYNIDIIKRFMHTMEKGDVVISCFSSRTIDAIGIVTGDYEWHDEFSQCKRVRKVEWLVKELNEDIVGMNGGETLHASTVYKLRKMNVGKIKTILAKYGITQTLTKPQPYVIVIDELNRGNVSKIFGELITLLEPDKRKGMKNAESIILPYSKKTFYIPSNVYLIATMNTADRSLGTLDYAIRRRFAFVTVKPKKIEDEHFRADLFRKVSELFIANYDEYVDNEFEDTIRLMPAETLCEEYRPEDVWIGHSYFIMNGDDEVRNRLLYEIIPLLEEYVRDGVLTNEAQTTIDELYQMAIQK